MDIAVAHRHEAAQPLMPTRATGPILLATTGSPDCANAARAAGDLAKSLHAGVHVVHTWMPLNTAFGPAGQPQIDFEKTYAEPAAEVLHSQVAALASRGVTVAGEHLLMGSAGEEVASLATTVGAQLVVTGSRGLGLIKRLVLGSVSEAVVAASATPVLVIRAGDESWPPDTILVGVDGSESSRSAAAVASALGQAVGAAVTIVTVITPDQLMATLPGDAARAAEAMVRGVADELAETYQVSINTAVLYGEAAPALLSLAATSPPALLAVGSRGGTVLRHLTLGSVSMAVLHGAEGAVLVSHSATTLLPA